MSQDQTSLDLIRWTFTVRPEGRSAIEEYLTDLGLDVLVQDATKFVVTWEEPAGEVEEVIEEIWALNGEPFEVTQEDFHRLGIHIFHHDETEPTQEAA